MASPPEMQSPARQPGHSRKAKIIAAAKAHFALRGVDGASTREIAKEAGVAQSLLLYHFATKEDLWKAVVDHLFETADKVINPDGALWELPPRQLLENYIDGFVTFCSQDADLHRLITLNGRKKGPRLDWVVETYQREAFNRLRRAIVTGQKEGWIKQADPTLLYYAILSIAGTTYSTQPEIKRLAPDAKVPASDDIKGFIKHMIFND